jgi:hypothetical protein
MVKKRELKNFLSLLRAKGGRKKNKYAMIPQNYNRSKNVAMEHNYLVDIL